MRKLPILFLAAAFAVPAQGFEKPSLSKAMVTQGISVARLKVIKRISDLRERTAVLVAVEPEVRKSAWVKLNERLGVWEKLTAAADYAFRTLGAELDFVEEQIDKAEASTGMEEARGNRTSLSVITEISHKFSQVAGLEEEAAKSGDSVKALEYSALKVQLGGWLRDIGSEDSSLNDISVQLNKVDAKVAAIKKS